MFMEDQTSGSHEHTSEYILVWHALRKNLFYGPMNMLYGHNYVGASYSAFSISLSLSQSDAYTKTQPITLYGSVYGLNLCSRKCL